MSRIIKSISEAYSMQPETLSITNHLKRTNNPSQDIERIELEVMNENTNVYVGYNFDGIKKFECIANTMHVHYT